MSQNRQIIKSGQLQAKVFKKKGTLLRKKKKSIFEPEEWVVLCVHDDRVPLLEWYTSRATIFTHEPKKVADLLDCQFCQINIGEDRCFTIGFNDPDRVSMEFAARNKEECDSWVDYLCSTLKRLNCIASSENLYDPAPHLLALNFEDKGASNESLSTNSSSRQRSSPQLPRVLQLHDEIPFPSSSASSNNQPVNIESKIEPAPFVRNFSPPRNSTIERRTTTIHQTPRLKKNSELIPDSEPDDNPPPLPPRKSTCLEAPLPHTNGSHNNEYNRLAHQYDYPISPSAQYDKIKFEKKTEDSIPYDKISFRNGESQNRAENVLSAEHANTSRSSSSGLESRFSFTSNPIHEDYNSLPSAPPRPPKTSSYDYISIQNDSRVHFNEHRNSYDSLDKVKTISILLTICVEHIVFVDIGSKVWIAGWSENKNSNLCGLIHIGDELIQVGDVEVTGLHQLPALFYSQSIPGTPVKLKIRSLPHGTVYSLTKPEQEAKSLGIVLHKRKNKIEDVVPKSPASVSQIPCRVSPYLYGSLHVMPVITEVDNIPLSLFASNDQFFKRVLKLPPGSSFTLILHPQDFIQLMKEQLKHVKSARKFIQDS